jgi:hypothetical protein
VGLALTEDNLLAHVSSTSTPPQTRGNGQAQSIQLGKQAQDDETSSSLSLDSEDIRYYSEKLRRKHVTEVTPGELTQSNPTALKDSDADILTTPQLIERVDQSNPGWQGVQSSLSGLQEILHRTPSPASLFNVNIPVTRTINYPSNSNPASPTTPPFNKFINLDLEKTPCSPAVIRTNTDMINVLKGSDKDVNPFHISTEQQVEEFETSVVMSKVTTDHIINSDFQRPSTPTPKAPNKEALSFDEITHIRELWSELATYYSMLRPERISNFHALAKPAYAFINGYQESAWCDIIVGTNTARNLYVSAPANATPTNYDMDTDEVQPSASLPKDQQITTPTLSVPISNWSPTPAPVPTPTPTPSPPAPTLVSPQPSNTDFPTLNAAYIKLHKSPIKVGKPKPFANIAPKIAKKPIQPPKGVMNGPPSSLLPQIDALGSQNPKTNNKSIAPNPIPHSDKPVSKGKPSYAQAIANPQIMPFTEASIKIIGSLDPTLPSDIKESIIRGLPRLPPPKPSPKPINPKSSPTPKTVAISKGPSRKLAIFVLDGTLHATMLQDVQSITSGMNVYLDNTISDIRVETGRVTSTGLHLSLNLVPNPSNFQYIRSALVQVLCLHDIPEDALIPYSPQSEAHLIIKGLDYYTTPYSTRPKDALNGQQVINFLSENSRLDGLSAVRTPRVIKSKGSNDMAVAFLDVWDSQNSINTKDIVNKMYHIHGKLVRIEYARPREFVPQCQKCWAWTHGTKACRLNHYRCPKCNGGHKEENHNLFADCCNEECKKSDGNTIICSHEPRCRNCGEQHSANDYGCIFNLNKHNRKWHSDRIAENKIKRAANIKAAFNSASPPLPSA